MTAWTDAASFAVFSTSSRLASLDLTPGIVPSSALSRKSVIHVPEPVCVLNMSHTGSPARSFVASARRPFFWYSVLIAAYCDSIAASSVIASMSFIAVE